MKRIWASLRGRLLVGTMVWILVSVGVAGWVLTDLFRQHISRQVIAELTVHLNQLAAFLGHDAVGQPQLQGVMTDPRWQLPYSGLYWQVESLAPHAVVPMLRSRSLWDQRLNLPADALVGVQRLPGPEGTEVLALSRIVRLAAADADYRLVVAIDASAVQAPLAQFRRLLIITLGLLSGGLALAAAAQVLLGLRPLARLRSQLAAVRDGRQAHLQGEFPAEVQPLAEAFNQVLQNQHDLVQRARAQAGNLAHALKTPLSVLANGAAQQPGEFGQLVSEQVAQARRHVDHHLARARAAATARTLGVRSPVLPVVQTLARVLARLHADKGVQIVVDGVPATLVFHGEAHDLQEMLGNILENACQWTDRHVWVHAAVLPVAGTAARAAGSRLVLRIQDDGPGLSEPQREQVFGRGVRLDERRPGSGLGLAIVRDLAQAYGGSVHAQAAPQGGLEVVLALPGGLA